MFYAHIVLAKKGPLARIWLAAHWDKKLTKAHVFETNIEQSVEGIMQPKVKLALRTSGHLLLGVVRIYSRKAKYLLADCNEAFVKIKMAFRPGIVDLPEGHREAAVNAITLPEVFHDFDTALPELNDVDIEAQFSINQSRADEITMREDYGSLSISIHDDGFGDMGGFDAETADLVREGIDAHIDGHLFAEELTEEIERTKEPIPGTSRDVLGDEFVEGFGEADFQAVGLFEGDIFGEPSAPPQPAELRTDLPVHDDSEEELDHFDTGAPSPMPSEIESRPPTALGVTEVRERLELPGIDIEEGGARAVPELGEPIVTEDNEEHAPADQTTIIHDEEESFALAPVDASAFKGVTKAKRKRKLIVDEVKNISGEEMKSQLANTSDIVTTLDLAPPTKRLMYWKETGGVEKLFALPSRNIPARCLFSSYHRNLISRATVVEDFSMLGPTDVLAIDQLHEAESPTAPTLLGKKGRKRKLPFTEPVTPLPAAEISLVSQISECEQLREAEAQARISMEIPVVSEVTEPLMPPPATPVSAFDSLRSYPLPDLSGLGPMTPALPSIPGIELGETPIPVLPADQVSSILAQEGGEEDYGQRFDSDLAPDWGEDYFPPSVGAPQPGEEQMEDETDEAFEERVLNKRAAQMFVAVRNRLQKKDTLLLSEMTYRNTRKQAAQKFYSLLVLKKFRALEILQDEPYADILVTKGPMFDNPKL